MLLPRSTLPLLGVCGICLVETASASPTAQFPARRAADVAACKLASVPGIDLSSGFGFEADCAPSTGPLSAFMFFVDFSDQAGPAGDDDMPDALYDFLVPGAAEWYSTSSYGRLALNVTADRTGLHRMPVPASSYGWDRGLTYEAHETYIQDALEAYVTVGGGAPPETDVLYVVASRAATRISFSPTFMGPVATRAGVRVASKAVTIGYDAYDAWRHLVLNHETGHAMCLPDFYPIDGQLTGLYVGGWDLMGYINGPSPDYLAWNKWRLGWLDDAAIDCIDGADSGSTTHVLSPVEVETDGGATRKAVVVRRSGTEALVAEARSRRGVDADACAAGVLLYTVSTDTASGAGPVRVLDANPGSGGCADDELNDAALTLDGASEFAVPGWDVTVRLTAQDGDVYTIQVDIA